MFRLSKANADQFQRLCKLYSHVNPQILFNDLVLLGLGQMMPSLHVTNEVRSSNIYQHLSLQSEPFAEFHGLVFKSHTAIDRSFAPDEPEVQMQTNAYALDESRS